MEVVRPPYLRRGRDPQEQLAMLGQGTSEGIGDSAQARQPSPPTVFNGKIKRLTGQSILNQNTEKLTTKEFDGQVNGKGMSWYDWSYAFQIKMELGHLWPLFTGDIRKPPSTADWGLQYRVQ